MPSGLSPRKKSADCVKRMYKKKQMFTRLVLINTYTNFRGEEVSIRDLHNLWTHFMLDSYVKKCSPTMLRGLSQNIATPVSDPLKTHYF